MKTQKKYILLYWIKKRREKRNTIIKTTIIGITLMLLALVAAAQDTIKTLSPQQLAAIIRLYHPIARQADINIEKAKAGIITAKGGFDPLLTNATAQKTFDGNNYYYYNRPEITIPTWYGISINGGLEYLSGNRTDPRDTKGESSFIGITIPLAKNLLMDKRRAALQTAKIMKEASAVEKRSIINTLMQEALTMYWNWVKHYLIYKLASDAIAINEKRIELIRISFRQGDRPALDTIEALTQLQNFQLWQSQARLDFQNMGLELSNYLWAADNTPFFLQPDVIPDEESQMLKADSFVTPDLAQILETIRNQHPDLLQYQFKLSALDIEKKLKFQEILPTVNFRYNQLGRGYDIAKTITNPLFENSFQYGISIGIPLRLSAGRGEYKTAKLKITETKLQQYQKIQQLENKIKSYYNELAALKTQVSLYEKAVQNYNTLLKGEETRLLNGESSLFLVNNRESKTLEALQKLTELKVKYFQANSLLLGTAGMLN